MYSSCWFLEEWQKGKKKIKGTRKNLGGTMRLGLYDAVLKNNSLISKIYSEKKLKKDIDIGMK